MNKKKLNNFPKKFTFHLIKEFLFSLIIFFAIIFCLVIILNFIEELFYLKDTKYNKNLYLYSLLFTLIKSPSLIINMSPFIFLFSGIHFFVKLLKRNEFISLNISGISNLFITLVPSLVSFFIGLMIILIISPISSEMIKHYEKIKKNISGNTNLLIVNENGIWVKEVSNNKIVIFRAEQFVQLKEKLYLKDLSIFIHDDEGKILENLFAKNAEVFDDTWELQDVIKYEKNFDKKNVFKFLNYKTSIKLDELNNIFSNSDTFSVWNIKSYLQTLKLRGYTGDELTIKYHRYISLPLLLFSIVIFSSIFTINLKQRHENYVYIFAGIFFGIIVYFLIDLSIAFGQSGKLPISLSVWMPVVLILLLSLFNLLRSNEN